MSDYFGNGDRLTIDGASPPASASDLKAGYNVVSPEYFNVMGIDILRGRAIVERTMNTVETWP